MVSLKIRIFEAAWLRQLIYDTLQPILAGMDLRRLNPTSLAGIKLHKT
jgi:hypothetical protein